MNQKLDNFFHLTEKGTNPRREIMAGLTTFMSMAYILAVNPNILSAAGMNASKVFTATVVASVIGTLIMGVFANYPIALSSAMGLNAYFAYSVCGPLSEQGVQDPWKIALFAIFCEGVIFILLSFCNFREKLVNDVPDYLKAGITAGIGLFITIIGLKNAHVVVADSGTVIGFGDLGTPEVALALIGVIIIAYLVYRRVMGALLYGMLITWGLGILAQFVGWYQVNPLAGEYSLIPSFKDYSIIPSAPYFCEFSIDWVANNIFDFCVIVFSFLFVDLFDTVGTLIGIADKANLLEDGKLPRAKQALLSDAIGTLSGACVGTSTVSSFVESSAGVSAGGRTGLTSVTTAVLFLVALLFAPIFTTIPSFATTPVLVYVGLLMIGSIKRIDFDNGDIADVVGGFFAIIMMPFTASVAYGIMFGILSWVILKVICGRAKQIPGVMWIAAALFVLKLITMVV